MRFAALACDYDGTIATDGIVRAPVVDALGQLAASGRRLVLVTGRRLEDLLAAFPHAQMFDRIVAENGGVLFDPSASRERALAEPPPGALLNALREAHVPVSAGRVILATHTPHETTVVEAIGRLGLEHHVIFNKGSVMVLPSGVNKATGLAAALDELALSPHNVVGVGDAENDHAFLSLCECAAAVADALPAVRERCDITLGAADGDGCVELVERLISDDLASAPLGRHDLALGSWLDTPVRIPMHGATVLVAGPSGSGKSTVVGSVLERLAADGRQFFVLDPEGDHTAVESAVVLGDAAHAPGSDEIAQAIADPGRSVVVNLTSLSVDERPRFADATLTRLAEARSQWARPHWIVLDEAHHLLPAGWGPSAPGLPWNVVLVTVQPSHVSERWLAQVDVVVATGDERDRVISDVARAAGAARPAVAGAAGDATVWFRAGGDVVPLEIRAPEAVRKRHSRKYAAGELGDGSFVFRGPDGRLNLRANNLTTFTQLARGVDDATWTYHLRRGDYARWFDDVIKDEELAAAARGAEDPNLPADVSRHRIISEVERLYTAPS